MDTTPCEWKGCDQVADVSREYRILMVGWDGTPFDALFVRHTCPKGHVYVSWLRNETIQPTAYFIGPPGANPGHSLGF